MQRLKPLGVALLTVLALGACISAVASAEELPNFLPLGTEANPVTFITKSGTTTFETAGGASIRCTSSASADEVTSPHLGRFDELLLGCEEPTSKVKCTGLGDATAGSILVRGEFHWRYILPLGWVRVVLWEHIHLSCFVTLRLFLGCTAGTISRVNELTSSITLTLKQTKGVNEIGEVDNQAHEGMETCVLKVKRSAEEKEEQAGEEQTAEAEHFQQEGKAVEALVMA